MLLRGLPEALGVRTTQVMIGGTPRRTIYLLSKFYLPCPRASSHNASNRCFILATKGPPLEASNCMGIQFTERKRTDDPPAGACVKCEARRHQVTMQLCLNCANTALDRHCRDALDTDDPFDAFLTDRMDEGEFALGKYCQSLTHLFWKVCTDHHQRI